MWWQRRNWHLNHRQLGASEFQRSNTQASGGRNDSSLQIGLALIELNRYRGYNKLLDLAGLSCQFGGDENESKTEMEFDCAQIAALGQEQMWLQVL